MIVKAGSTDVSTYFKLRLSATGLTASGLTITNLDLYYTRSGAAQAAKVDATALAAADSAHADNKAFEAGQGVYRIDWPDAAFAAGVREVILTVVCATCFDEDLRVELSPLVVADTVSDKTGYALTTAPPTAVAIRTEMDSNSTKLAAAALEATLTAMKGGSWSTETLKAIKDAIPAAAPTAAAVAGAVLDEAKGAHAGHVASIPTNPYTGTPPTADAIGTDAAGKILATPAYKIATNASGQVTYSNAAPPDTAAIVTAMQAAGTVLTKLLTAIELDGAVYRLTANALELAPTGGSAPTTDQIVAALKASTGWTAGGTATFATLVKALYAMAHGKIAKSGDAYTFYDDDGTTPLFTLTIAAGARTPS